MGGGIGDGSGADLQYSERRAIVGGVGLAFYISSKEVCCCIPMRRFCGWCAR